MVRWVGEEKRAPFHSQIYDGAFRPPDDTWFGEASIADKCMLDQDEMRLSPREDLR